MLTHPPDDLPETLWKAFLALGEPLRMEAGALLWEPGDPHEGESYLVVRGLVRLYHPSRKGDAVTLLAIGAGGLVGHHPLLEPPKGVGRPRATGAEALCSSDLLTLPAAHVTTWLRGTDATSTAFSGWLRRTVDQQLAETYTRLELEHDTARAKVAHVLLTLDRQTLLNRMTRQQIADLANLTIETTVRTTSHFTVLSEAERGALGKLLEPFEPDELPYS